ncbi:MAG: RNAse [Clostridiales bacterium]|nr:RNAse [Clostridiales bacterium]
MLDVCLLGTGGMMPLPNRWLASLLLRYKGRMLLIDCGEGTQIPMKILGWGFKAIDAMLFTHYHADHIAGLPGLLLSIGNSGRKDPLTLMGPQGLKKVVEGLTVISPELPYELKLIELSDSEESITCLNNIFIKSIPVDHGMPCLSYNVDFRRLRKFDAERAKALNVPVMYWKRLQKGEQITLGDRAINPEMVLSEPRKGIKISYCTDSRPTEGLVQLIQESDLFICEGMYGDESDYHKAEQNKHMMFSEAGVLAKQGNVKELWLTHYSPSLIKPEDYIESAKVVFINTIAGRDLLTKSIKYSEHQ